MADRHVGHCFCGAVEIAATGAPAQMGYCHCASCRHYTGSPLAAFILWREEQVSVTAGADLVGRFNRTGMSERMHCRRCGGHLMTGHPGLGWTDVYASMLPTVAFVPAVHLNYAEAVLPIRDGLPKLRDFPAEAGGTGETVEE